MQDGGSKALREGVKIEWARSTGLNEYYCIWRSFKGQKYGVDIKEAVVFFSIPFLVLL